MRSTILHACVAISLLPVIHNKAPWSRLLQKTATEMQLFVQGQALHTITVSEETTVDDLKGLLAEKEGIPTDDQVLTYAGSPLEEDCLVGSVLPELATLTLTARVVGGKVHGSLARAGKVRGQTPKIDPQEKKKKKTGRAKRRMQYNRRFVNAVVTFGRRRGPNSNAQ